MKLRALVRHLKKQEPDKAAPKAEASVSSAEPVGRSALVSATLAGATADNVFADLIRAADSARDGQRWEEARSLYDQALKRWPLHPGYTVQIGHMFKELGNFTDASFAYRRALALGHVDEDTQEHFVFASRRADVFNEEIFRSVLAYWARRDVPAPLDAPPIFEDVYVLEMLLVGRHDSKLNRKLNCECASLDQVGARIVARDDFIAANLELLLLMREAKF